MPSTIARSLDELATWREALGRHVVQLGRALTEQELLDDSDAAVLLALRERLSSEKLVLAFVAEFSRGKSELINAIFFADAGRRVLPATPGRTTMCPVELRYEPDMPPRLALLPIETRLRGLSLSELRPREELWQMVPLEPRNPVALSQALSAVTRVQRVSLEQAAALGFWDESQPDDNPPVGIDGLVEVPAWRHAVINYPHPLLERGLVVIDTPGLNAIGAQCTCGGVCAGRGHRRHAVGPDHLARPPEPGQPGTVCRAQQDRRPARPAGHDGRSAGAD